MLDQWDLMDDLASGSLLYSELENGHRNSEVFQVKIVIFIDFPYFCKRLPDDDKPFQASSIAPVLGEGRDGPLMSIDWAVFQGFFNGHVRWHRRVDDG